MAGYLPGYADYIGVVSERVQQAFDQYKGKFTKKEWMAKIAAVLIDTVGELLLASGTLIETWFLSIENKWLQWLLSPIMVPLAGILGLGGTAFKVTAPFFDPEATGWRSWVQTAVVETAKTGWSNVVDVTNAISSLVTDLRNDPILTTAWSWISSMQGAGPDWMKKITLDHPFDYLKLAVNAYNTVDDFVDSTLRWLGIDKVIEELVGYNIFLANTVEHLTSQQKSGAPITFVNN
tara:strand:- start:240 stop:944 length:705 start_codon:yes stop_codon:yes gene_type:complete